MKASDPDYRAQVRHAAETFRRQNVRTVMFDILPDEERDRRHRLAAEGHPPSDEEIDDICESVEAAYDVLGIP